MKRRRGNRRAAPRAGGGERWHAEVWCGGAHYDAQRRDLSRSRPAARTGERESGAAPTRAPAGRATAPRSTAARPAARAARCANRPGRHCGRSPPRGRVRAVARNVRAFTRARRTRPARRRCQRQLRRGSLAARTHWVRDAQCSRLMRDTSAQRAFRAARGHRSVCMGMGVGY